MGVEVGSSVGSDWNLYKSHVFYISDLKLDAGHLRVAVFLSSGLRAYETRRLPSARTTLH